MTTPEQAQATEDAPESTEPEAAKETGGGLRKELERTKAELKESNIRERARAFTDAGLDTSQGIGKAISQVYEGEPTPEAVATFANEEYGWVPTAQVETNPLAPAIQGGNARIEQVQQQSGSITPPTQADALAEAEAAGDYQRTMALKGAEVAAMFENQNR